MRERESKQAATVPFMTYRFQRHVMSFLFYWICYTDQPWNNVEGNYTRGKNQEVGATGDHLRGWWPQITHALRLNQTHRPLVITQNKGSIQVLHITLLGSLYETPASGVVQEVSRANSQEGRMDLRWERTKVNWNSQGHVSGKVTIVRTN